MKVFDTPLDEMLYILLKDNEQVVPVGLKDKDKRWLINSLMLIRSPGYLDDRFMSLQNDMLTSENKSSSYDCDKVKYKKHFALTRRNITDLKIDAICCETNSYLGDIDIDNKILLKAGLAIREECNKINSDNNYICKMGSAFALSGYNLSTDNVIKIILPKVKDAESKGVDIIQNGIIEALDLIRDKKCKSFAINLSLDKMFNIPNEVYINIVLNTIRDYLKTKKYKLNCLLVVDNDIDETYIKNILKIKQVY